MEEAFSHPPKDSFIAIFDIGECIPLGPFLLFLHSFDFSGLEFMVGYYLW